jgi:rhamnose utilization protein RhaD (predicted bifunctional aldolase and dehydrogenase)
MLQELRTLSARLGRDPLLVQAAGGNTSLKREGVMWIKASGTWLCDAEDRDIFVPVDLAPLQAALAAQDPSCESCTDYVRQDLNPLGLRPSIETSVHGLMRQTVVLHVHCVNTIAWAIRADAQVQLEQKLHAFNWAFVPYARPGLHLSQAIQSVLTDTTDVLILQNHGLAVAAATLAEASALLMRVVEAIRIPARKQLAPDMVRLNTIAHGTDYVPVADVEAHHFALEEWSLTLAGRNVYYPDHVVFLGTSIPTDITTNAMAVAIPGTGLLRRKDAKPAVVPMLRCLSDVFRRVEKGISLKALTVKEVDQLLNWDAEKYRQSLKQP